MEILDQLKFDEKGLITAVVQDIDTNQILMVAYMNREAVKKNNSWKPRLFLEQVTTRILD